MGEVREVRRNWRQTERRLRQDRDRRMRVSLAEVRCLGNEEGQEQSSKSDDPER